MEPSGPPTRKTGRMWPLSHAERVATFGAFTFTHRPTPGNPERVDIQDKWERENLIVAQVPQLGMKRVKLHRKVADPFLGLFLAWDRAGLLSKVLSFDGMYAPRFKRFSGTVEERIQTASKANAYDLSNHAWGTAFDINAGWNRLGRQPADMDEVGTVRPLVGIAYELGWFWGGHFRSRPDGQHFEYVGEMTVAAEEESV